MKAKLLIFHPALAPYRVDFFNLLSEHFDLTVVMQAREMGSQKFDQEKLMQRVRFTLRYMPWTWIGDGRKVSLGYFRYIREIRPDIVLGSEFGSNVLMPYLLRPFFRKKYKVWTSTDDSIETTLRCRKLRGFFRRFLSLRIDGILFANADTREWFNAHLRPCSSAYVPIIADETVIRRMIEEHLSVSAEWERKYDLTERRRVLFVGRFDPVKNLHRLLEAFVKVRKDSVLLLVGSGEERPSLEEDVRRLGLEERVIFTGRWEMPELYQWYQLADVMVLPSVTEAFGAVVGEALQAGCPVVCSSEAGAAGLIRSGGNGEVVNPYDVPGIIGAIEKVLEREPAGSKNILRPSLMPSTLPTYLSDFTKTLYESLH